jgi:phage-related protein
MGGSPPTRVRVRIAGPSECLGLVLQFAGNERDFPVPFLVRRWMTERHKRIPARFYRSDLASEPVRDWLKSLDKPDRSLIGLDIKIVEFGWPIGMPVCRPMGKGVYEVRTGLAGNRIARVLFCISRGQMVLLHGFIKKSQKTPKPDLDLALQRKRLVEREQ